MKNCFIILFFFLSFSCFAQWSQVGSNVATLAQTSSLAVDGSTPYAAYRNVISGNKLNVKKYDGSSWVQVGAPNFSSGAVGGVDMGFDSGGTLYTAHYENGSSNITVHEFDGSNWQVVGAPAFATGISISLAFDGTTPYVAFSEATGGGMSVMSYNGSSWNYVGTASFSASGSDYASLVFDGTTPFVAFQDFGNGSKATVMSYSGGSWSNVGSAGFSPGGVQFVTMAIDSGTPYVTYKDDDNGGKASVMKYNGSSWEDVGSPGFSPGIAQYTSIVIYNGNPYVAYRDDPNSDKARVDFFNGSSWNQLGSNLGAGQSANNVLRISGNTAYTVFVDGAASFAVQVHEYVFAAGSCDITSSGLSNVQCNDNGTPADPSDDYITFDLDPDGMDLGTDYTVTGANLTPSGGNYGGVTSFQTDGGTAGGGDLTLTIVDGDDPLCTFSFTLTDPGSCSDDCVITGVGLSNIACNDNGTPTDPSDDYITFELNPAGNNLGTSYTVSGTNLTPSGANYGASTSFQTDTGTAGDGDLNLTVTDDDDANCDFTFTVSDPNTCSDECELLDSGLSNVQCNDNGTPTDPSDDYITFELDPSGSNLGLSYTVTGTNLSPSGANYGSSTTFQTDNGTAGDGDLTLTISDDDNANCDLIFMVTDPNTCSDDCEITASGLGNVQCNDNGTPSDPSDDYITFDLNPTGNNLGTFYTLSGATTTPTTGSYGVTTSFQTPAGTAGGGDLNLTITDNVSGTCDFSFVVTDPGTCSGNCEITVSGLTNIQCNNNGTSSDPSDDYITFELNPTGNNLGISYTVSGTNLSPSGANYGSSTTFQTDSGTAGGGDLTLTITDDSNGGCTLNFTLTDPNSCSPDCAITGSGLTNIQCNNNGTPSDETDDYITFDLNPTGNNLGTFYTVSGATTTPTTGNYGVTTSFQTPAGTAGGGDLNLTITDNVSGTCDFSFVVTDPGTCSGNCEITASGLTNIQCNDNGTSSDPSDDYITFELNPTGNNLGISYTVSGTNLSPSGANYGSSTTFQTDSGTAGGGDLTLTITDDSNGGCTLNFTLTDPNSCSPDCAITASGLANIACNDNGTPSDDTDDYITFDLNPTGNNLGTTYSVSGTVLIPTTGNYGGTVTFQTSSGTAGGGDLNLTITDNSSGGCTLIFTLTDPGSCSNNCEITASGLTNIQCNDNGTSSDPSDDYITFELNPTGNNLGIFYTVSGTTTTPTTGNYGGSTTFQTNPGTAGNGDLNLTISDNVSGGCTFNFTVTDPDTCSPNCAITASGLSNVTCNDNGTPSDPSDDYITFDLNPTGNNLGTSYTVSGTTLTPNGGNYGGITSFQTNPGTAGGGPLNLTVTDDVTGGCTLNITVDDPGTCSGTCNITDSGLANIACNDNGTPSDDTDDYITFDLDPSGNNLGTSYTVSGTDLTPSGSNYGALTSFQTNPGTAGDGDLTLTITDDSSGGCTFSFTVSDPGDCSDQCILNDAGFANLLCDNNGTLYDPSDDSFTFDLDPTGLNLSPSGYLVSSSVSITPSSANYGSATSFETASGSAGGGDLVITVTDGDNSSCTVTADLIDPTPNPNIVNVVNPTECGGDGTIVIGGLISGIQYDIVYDNLPSTDNVVGGVTANGLGEVTVNLPEGTYTNIRAKKTNDNCIGGSLSATLTDPANPTYTVSGTNPTSCNGSEGSFTLSGLNANTTYTLNYSDDGTPIGPLNLTSNGSGEITVSNLDEGDYTDIILTLNNCVGSALSVTLTGPTSPVLSETHTDTTCPGGDDGSIDLTVTGGSPGYEFDWDNDGTGDNDDSEDISNLTAGTYSVTVTDAGSCTATLSVEIMEGLDSEPPTAVCQDITVELDGTGNASIMPAEIDNGSTDNCGTVNLNLDISAFDCTDIGTNAVILTVDDGNANSNNCSATVTVEDNEAPSAQCQDLTVELDGTGNASITAVQVNDGSFDNCGSISLSLDITTFDCSVVGSNTVTLSVDDGNGNISTCSSNVTVQDNEEPMAVCQDITVELDGTGNASITPAEIDNGSTDNCNSVSLSLNITDFDCTEIGANTVTLTADDDNGNSDNCAATVAVEDNESPTAVCQDITVELDGTGNISISPVQIDNGSSDNCNSVNLSLDNSDFDCTNIGTNTVTLTATDGGGNSDDCTAIVTVADNESPTAVCQDITIELDGTGNVSITPVEIDNGSSDNCNSVSLSLNITDFDCTEIGANTVTLTADDGNGNSDNCAATVTVEDNESPTAVCQDIMVELDGTGNVSITPVEIDNGSSDNCNSVSLSLNITDFDCTEIGANTVTLTADDGNGNSDNCAAIVTVEDNESPTAVCQDITVELDGTGNVSITPVEIDNGSFDNCNSVSLSLNITDFDCTEIGANTVILTATDGGGNSDDCTAIVTVEDNTAPIATCQNVTAELDTNGDATVTAVQINNGSSDNCGAVTLSLNITNFVCSNIGTNTVTLTVNDGNGNSSSCMATVTVEDNEIPTAICQDLTIQINANGTASINASQIDNGSSDNCTTIFTSIDMTTFDCSNVGANIVTLTVEDGSGNENTCTSTVTLEDGFAPMAVCQNITVELDVNGEAEILPSDIDNGSSDNCGTVILALNQDVFLCSDLGDNMVTLTVDDGNGNSDLCTAIVTVEDNQAPVAFCQDITVELDAGGMATITPQQIDVGSSDNCTGVSLSLDISNFECAEIGANTVTLTATDTYGNEGTCTSTVTVEDNTAPSASCEDFTIALDANGEAELLPADVDGGSSDNCANLTLQLNIDEFNCNDVGANPVTLTVDDGNGNTDFCNATVTVVDNMVPAAVCLNISVDLDNDGMATIEAEDVNLSSADNCGTVIVSIDNDSFDCTDLGANIVVLTVDDGNGNSSQCDATVTVEDNVAPAAICQDITIGLDANGTASINPEDLDDGSTDNCDSTSFSADLTDFNCGHIGNNTVILSVADGNGNTGTCASVVLVVDNLPPVAACQDVIVELNAAGLAEIVPDDVDGGTSDNCGTFTLSLNQDEFNCFDIGANIITLTVEDNGGNSDFCDATVTVEDNLNPNALCLSATVELDSDGNASITASQVDAGSSDNCQAISLSINNDTFDCDDIGSNIVTLTVTDSDGNSDECDATVIVQDNLSPTAICQDITVDLDSGGNASVTGAQVNNGSTDNCGGLEFSLDISSFDCSTTGPNDVVLTVEDGEGNSATCSAVITVLEGVPPTATCSDITAELDSDGMVEITPQQVDNGSSDNCSSITLSLDNDTFYCSNIGINTVTLTVEDASGNLDSCSANIQVEDNLSPNALCMDIIIELDSLGNAVISENQIDNGSNDNCVGINFNLDLNSFDCADVGNNTVVLTVNDDNGNSNSCSATVTVQENLSPIAVCQDITVQLDVMGIVTVSPAQINNGSSDNCGISTMELDITTFDCMETGPNSVTLTVTDNYNNSSQCSAIVTVTEDEPPSALCQNVSVILDSEGLGTISTDDVDGGSADNCGDVMLSLDITQFDCDDEGLNTVTLTVEDVSGNISTCTAQVEVIDNTVPAILCQNPTIELDSLGMATLTVQDVDDGSFDNCHMLTLSINIEEFDCSDLGVNQVILTGDDGIGSANQCISLVLVEDNLPPVVVCQDVTVQLDANNMGTLTPEEVEDSSSDNCGTVNLSIDQNTFDCSHIGSNTVTLTADDGNGNTSNCTSTVIVAESIPPTALCQNITVDLAANGMGEITADQVDNGSSDNCVSVQLSLDNDSFDCSNLGPNTVTLTVTDDFGNASECQATVSVMDNVNPTAVCQNTTVELNADGNVTLNPTQINNGSTDNCQVTDFSLDISAFNCSSVGTHFVTLTVFDQSGNQAQCIGVVTVEDNLPPVAAAQDITVALDAGGMASITAGMIENGSSDNCEIDGFEIDITDFDCDDVGTNQVLLTVTDIYGNVGTATATVTVTENENPIAVSQNLTVVLDADGLVSITPQEVDNGSTDNCEIADISLDIQNFDCSHIGQNNVVMTVTDGYGNMSSSVAVITVLDTLPPSIVCPSGYSSIDCNNVITYETPTINDNCQNGTFVLVSGLPSGSVFPSGDTEIVWSYMDLSGNMAECSFTITAPEKLVISQITSEPVSCHDGEDGSITVTPQHGIPPYSYLWNDNQMTQIASGLSPGIHEVTVTDSIGCETVGMIDLPNPTEIIIDLDSTQADINMGNTGAIFISVDGGAGNYAYSWIFENNIVSNNEDPMNLEAGHYVVQVQDENGCIVISDTIEVEMMTPTNEPDWASEMLLTPNPTTGILFLKLPNSPGEVKIEIFNLIGQKIDFDLTQNASTDYRIELNYVPSGIYLVKISDGNAGVSRRIMVGN